MRRWIGCGGFPQPRDGKPGISSTGSRSAWTVQIGLDPGDWKPMRSVGPGVIEIRIHTGGEYRVFYVARLTEAVYVLHAFEKRTRRTRQTDIELGRRNLAEILRSRRGE